MTVFSSLQSPPQSTVFKLEHTPHGDVRSVPLGILSPKHGNVYVYVHIMLIASISSCDFYSCGNSEAERMFKFEITHVVMFSVMGHLLHTLSFVNGTSNFLRAVAHFCRPYLLCNISCLLGYYVSHFFFFLFFFLHSMEFVNDICQFFITYNASFVNGICHVSHAVSFVSHAVSHLMPALVTYYFICFISPLISLWHLLFVTCLGTFVICPG